MITGDIPDAIEHMDVDTLRVYAPSKCVLVCGGRYDYNTHRNGVLRSPWSLRDAYLRISLGPPFAKYANIVPDDLDFRPPIGPYDELLQLESDLAQIAELVVLFSESEGSFAELGAFCVIDEISPRLLVVIDNLNYEDGSFIRLGPLHSLLKAHGEASVFILNCDDVGIERVSQPAALNVETFGRLLAPAFEQRLGTVERESKFNPKVSGHVIKLITGLIQHYGAMTLSEIKASLERLGIVLEDERIRQMLFCGETLRWVERARRGFETYYLPKVAKAAFMFEVKEGSPNPSRLTWRTQIRDHWRQSDTPRFSAISANATEIA